VNTNKNCAKLPTYVLLHVCREPISIQIGWIVPVCSRPQYSIHRDRIIPL